MSAAQHAAELSESANIIRLALIDYAARTLGREKAIAEELVITAPQHFDEAPELREMFDAAKAVGIQQEQRIMDLEAERGGLLEALQAAERALNNIRCCCHHTAWEATGPAVIAARAAIAKATGSET